MLHLFQTKDCGHFSFFFFPPIHVQKYIMEEGGIIIILLSTLQQVDIITVIFGLLNAPEYL